MPPRDPNLDALWAEVRTSQPAWQLHEQRNRPMPRQMRAPEIRARATNPGVRRQAEAELNRRFAAEADPRTAPRLPRGNQFAEAGAMALEGTGLPSIRRGTAGVTRGAMNQDPMQGLGQVGAGAVELGLGGLGVAGLGVGAAPRAPRLPPRLPATSPTVTPRDPEALSLARSWIDSFGGGPTAEARAIEVMREQLQEAGHPAWRQRLQDAIDSVGARTYVQGERTSFSPRVEEAWPEIYSPEPMPRMTPPPREIAPNGLPIRPAEPFRNSLRGGSEDLAEAARPQFDIGPLHRGHQGNPSTGHWRASEDGLSGPGVYLTNDEAQADYWALRQAESDPTVHTVNARGPIAEGMTYEEARAQGYKGLRYRGRNGYDETVIFDPADVSPSRSSRPARSPQAPDAGDITARAPNGGNAGGGQRIERRTLDIPYPEWGRDAGKTFEVLQNPTGDQLTRFATQDARGAGWRGPLEGYELRFVRDLDGNVFFVSGYNAEHSATAAGLRARGVNVGEGTRGEGGAGLVTFRDGSWRWSNAGGDVLEPIDFGYGRAPNAPAKGPDSIGARAPTLPRQGFTRPQAQGTSPAMAPPPRRGMFGRMDRPGVRDMQPEGIYGSSPNAQALEQLAARLRAKGPEFGGDEIASYTSLLSYAVPALRRNKRLMSATSLDEIAAILDEIGADPANWVAMVGI